MQEQKFDLVEIINTIKAKGKLVLGITLLGLIAAVIFVAVRPSEYTSEANIIIKGFMNFDRTHMYSQNVYYPKEVFAKESEMDKAMTVLESGEIKAHVIKELDYMSIKKMTPKEAFAEVKENLQFMRTDNYDILAKFTDTDPRLALKGLEAALQKAEQIYTNFFQEYNRDVSREIDFKRKAILDSLVIINDSIQAVRKRYNLYSELLPTRGTVISTPKAVNENSARGIEELQTLIYMKDKIDEENGKLAALKNEFSSYLNKEKMQVFYRVNQPFLPDQTSNTPAIYIILTSVIAAFLFACLLVLSMRALRMHR